jgi:hypothetical protein
MRLTDGIRVEVTLVWIGLATIFVANAVSHRKQVQLCPRTSLSLSLGLLGYGILPFAVSSYITYFNARLAPITYVLWCLVLAGVPLTRAAAAACVALTAALLVFSGTLQGRLARETAEITPLLQTMEPNASMLPLVIEGGSSYLDPYFFYQFHGHVPLYYHVRVGGGTSSVTFQNPLLPVRSRSDALRPVREPDGGLSIESVARHYRYVLARGLPPALDERLASFSQRVLRSGPWTLFETAR